MKLEHIALNVPEPKTVAQWYVDNLDMKIVLANDTAPFIHFIADESGSMVELYNNPLGEMPDYKSMSPFTLHFAFATDDIPAMRDRLVAAGARVLDEISTTPAGDKLLFLKDPWGITVQFVQRAKSLI